MTQDERRRALSRRQFLQGAGAAAGAFVVGGVMSRWEPIGRLVRSNRQSGDAVKIGLLLPSSSINPDLGRSVLSGMSLGFAHQDNLAGGRPVELADENIGVGVNLAVKKARKLVEEDADLVVAVVNSRIAPHLRPIFEESQKVLLISNMGESVVSDNDSSPYIFHNSLGQWQSDHALGGWSARNIGTTAVMAAGLYDSGYDTLHAFQRGFEGAGGQISRRIVTDVPPSRDGPESAIRAIEKINPDVVAAFYCGPDAVEFVTAYDQAGLSSTSPLVGSAFTVDEGILPRQSAAAHGMRTAFFLGKRPNTPRE